MPAMQRERKSLWAVLVIAAVLGTPLVYLLSLGPVVWLFNKGLIPAASRCRYRRPHATAGSLRLGSIMPAAVHRYLMVARRASSSASLNRTLTMYAGSSACQCPYVVATKAPSARSSNPG